MQNSARRFASQLRRSRVALYTFLPLAAVAAMGVMETIQPALRLIYIVAGFSLIIFLHEFGHFIVARMCSVKCLAFSIGIGPRMCGWRQNGGLSFGGDPYDPDSKKHKHVATETAAVQSDLPTAATEPRHSRAVGICDYRLSWLPLGGYVRMLGQDDMDPTKVSSDPHAFNQRPIWQRMCIVSAGVIMNVIFAAVCFSIIFSPGIGVDFPPARIGAVTYGMPAWGQLNMGDQIESINGEQVRGFLEFTDVMMASALAKENQQFTLMVIRYGTGKRESVSLTPKRSDASGFLAFGVEAMPGLKLVGKGADYTNADAAKVFGHRVTFEANKPELNKIKDEGWKITAIDDIDLRDQPEPNATHDKYVLLYNRVKERNGQAVTLSLENTTTKATQQITLLPHIEPVPGETKFPTVFGLAPQVIISEASPKSPAARAGLHSGDRITQLGDRSYPDLEMVRKIISGSEGKPLAMEVERMEPTAGTAADTSPATSSAPAGPPLSPKTVAVTVAAKKEKGNYIIGIQLFQDLRSTRFVQITPESAAPTLDLEPGATIAAIDGQAVANWQEIYAALRTKNADTQVAVTFNTTQGPQPRTFAYTKAESELVKEHLQFMLGLQLANETKTQKADNAGQAVLMGMDHTKKFILNVYMTLAGLFRGTVEASNLHGIVGITKVGYDVQERGPVWLWYVLAMVSVNLAVANFLPLPIVDGGLFLLLILEKVRGKPLSLKVQTAIQTAGIVLLAGLFIFVTMNDINLFK